MNVLGKNILITGGVNGIGRALVEQFVEEGANVGVLDVDKDGLVELKNKYLNVFTFVCDVGSSESVAEAFSNFVEKFKTIDILINNAAYIYNSPLYNVFQGKHDIVEWNKVIATDLNSVFYLSNHAVENMVKARTKGVIVNISSVCAEGNPGQGAYSAAKAGVNAATKAWAKELGVFGIRICGIAPGYVETETTQKSISPAVIEEVKKKTPIKRFASVDEIVKAVFFIVDNDFFNGKVLNIDGGLVV